ncbi:uncharacterized protein LOC144578976 [Callithrix jacchus]
MEVHRLHLSRVAARPERVRRPRRRPRLNGLQPLPVLLPPWLGPFVPAPRDPAGRLFPAAPPRPALPALGLPPPALPGLHLPLPPAPGSSRSLPQAAVPSRRSPPHAAVPPPRLPSPRPELTVSKMAAVSVWDISAVRPGVSPFSRQREKKKDERESFHEDCGRGPKYGILERKAASTLRGREPQRGTFLTERKLPQGWWKGTQRWNRRSESLVVTAWVSKEASSGNRHRVS